MEIIRQRSLDWHLQRLGHITGSQVDKIMTKTKDGSISSGGLTYCESLASDRVVGAPEENDLMTRDMERGIELEPIAVGRFEEEMTKLNPMNPMRVEEVGYIRHPKYKHFGVSLDGRTNESGSIEVKCRNRKNHIQQIIQITNNKLDRKVMHQMNWGMFCTGLSHCYFIGYTDDLPEDQGDVIIKKYERDDALIDLMEKKANQAEEIIEDLVSKYKILLSASNFEKINIEEVNS